MIEIAIIKTGIRKRQTIQSLMLLFAAMAVVMLTRAQSVSEIITNYNGYFKTGTAAVNPVKPDNNHDLLAFTFNGTRYSTGVNDALLLSHNETFTAANFRALPMNNITGTPTGNTKIGLGAMADGVFNGAGSAPSRTLAPYLSDGVNGLGLGTCIANLPAGTMFMSVSNLQASHIGDGIPDILVTQIADPSSTYDRYAFTDINGNMVGNFMDINLTNITPVGQWVADFYEATGSTILQPGFTQTQRNIRLWAADFSAFGINASNIGNIAYFKINLSGDSDIAFVAYNTTTVTVQQVLALPEFARVPVRRDIDNATPGQSMKMFPNPAVNTVTVNHPLSRGGEKIVVYSISGVAMVQQRVDNRTSQSRLNISGLRPGHYQVVYTDGYQKFTEKLLVK